MPLPSKKSSFHVVYSEAGHGKRLAKELDLSHLQPKHSACLTALIKKYWCIFVERATFVPVRHYQCIIDTGSAAPIAVKQIRYSQQEIPIMLKSIAALEKMGQICQIHDGQWLFKALLSPKPHQEHIQNIADFVWHFYVNYIPLHQVSRLIAYPIPCCNVAVENSFKGFWMWLYNAIMGYHQLAVVPESQEKIAFRFQGPNAIK